MDNTKKKQFIAFVNVSGRDRWWIDGNCTYDTTSPKIMPYETAEEKEIALRYGKTIGMWEETSDVHGILLNITGTTFEIINRKDADKLVQEQKEAEEKRKAESGYVSSEPAPKKKKKQKETKTVKEPVSKIEVDEKVTTSAAPTKVTAPIPTKKVGRPKLVLEE